jgi:hypothetical protein
MGRPTIFGHPMTAVERMRRHRQRRKAEIVPEAVVAPVVDALNRAPPKVGRDIMRRLSREIAKRQRKQEGSKP